MPSYFLILVAAFCGWHNASPYSSFSGQSGCHYNAPTIAGDWALDGARLPGCHINFNIGSNTFTGNTGCNGITGTFYKSGDSLRIDQQILALSQNACGGDEAGFLNALLKINRCQVSQQILTLWNKDTLVSTWNRVNK